MNVNRIRAALVLSVVAAFLGTASAFPPPVTSLLLKTIQSVSAEGKGNEAARKAVELLSASSVEKLPDILAGFDKASPLAANYLRAVVETIVDRQLADRTEFH